MTKKIKHASELPDWFQIKNYTRAKQLNAAGWFEQISARIIINKIITLRKYAVKHNYDEDFIKLTANFGEAITLVRQNPIVDTTITPELLNYAFFDSFKSLLETKYRLSFGIRPLTIGEFKDLSNAIVKDAIQPITPVPHEIYREYQIRKLFDTPLNTLTNENSSAENSIAHVNWNLPDTLLIEHFKKYLKDHRPKETHSMQRNRSPDFNSWHSFGVLPYLDLKIWQSEADVFIPNRVIADAIFSDGTHGEETIRKTTATITETILANDNEVDILAAQAYCEQSK